MSWEDILKASPNMDAIRRVSPSFAEEVERMVELRDNEELLVCRKRVNMIDLRKTPLIL